MSHQQNHGALAFIHAKQSSGRWRRLPLFLAVVLVAALCPAIAAQADPKPKTPTSKEHVNRAAKQSMKQNYAGGLPLATSHGRVAADDRQLSEPLSGAGEVRAATAQLPVGEILDRRTATSADIRNADGTIRKRQFFAPRHFLRNGQWVQIDSDLIADTNPDDLTGTARKLAQIEHAANSGSSSHLRVRSNDWDARFGPSDFPAGMIRLKLGYSEVGFSPIGANTVVPAVTRDASGKQMVRYVELWPGVDVEYTVHGSEVKENVVLKHRDAVTSVGFRVLGAKLKRAEDGFTIHGALRNEFHVTPINLILSTFGVVSDTRVYRQEYRNDALTVSVDRKFLSGLPDEAFPAVIDPGWYRSHFGSRAGGNYLAFKSDGYVCPSHVCNPYAGSVLDAGYVWRNWRGAIHSPYTWFQDPNKRLVNATLHLTQRLGLSVSGTTDPKWFDAWHATCHAYGCIGMWGGETYMGTVGDINVTSIYQNRIAAGDWGAWLMITGEENVPWTTYKNFDPDNSFVDFTYFDPPPAPGIAVPTANQTFIDPQVSFRLSGVGNPNNSDPLEYELLVSSNPGGGGTVIASGLLSATQWTVPDGILQDGSTYYVQARSYDNTGGGWGSWSGSVPFKIDTRTGKDATQTFDTLGPVSVDLATGNLTTGASSHSSAALGGSLGVSLDYNSPLRSRNGLVAEYWNNMDRSGNPVMSRVDQNIDFAWDYGSPSSGTIVNDYYSARWTGFFLPPVTGSYQFGSLNDDAFTVKIDGQTVHAATCCSGTPYFNGSPVSLTAGQPVPIVMEYYEHTGPAYARLMVKGAVNEQIVPSQWLQTGVRPTSQQYGLIGRYYHDDGSHDFNTNTSLFVQRVDPFLSFGWWTGAPMPGGPTDNFLVRWTGTVTVPATGSYQFGSISDDGVRVKINDNVVYENWTDHAATEGYNASVSLTAGQSVPITLEYYERGGGASLVLRVKGPDGVAQHVPSNWLNPKTQVLPDGWSLGIDPDGNLSYDRLKVMQNSAILTDSTGSTHEYTWTGSGYKPPVNEDGQLVRNADGTFTLQDTDGRTYVFGADGLLVSVTSPLDDRTPAALKYTYSGYPAKLTEITDGVTSDRWARIYYSGSGECGSAPTGFDGSAPASMLCAVKTNDGRSTHFYYQGGQLARIAEPGNEYLDFGYEQLSNGARRLASVRDGIANDAIAAGVRANDTSVLTQIDYDVLGRVIKVTQPAATAGANRIQHTIEYLPGGSGYYGATQQHVVGSPEAHGFSRRIEYDSTLRTIKDIDIANLADVTEWHPVKDIIYSATDEAGLKSTTIYDDDDRPTDNYGPAPAAWFGSDRKPLAAHAAQTPRIETEYDASIWGPAVAWYNVKNSSNSASFVGAPRLHTTGLTNPLGSHVFHLDTAQGHTLPIVAGSGMDGVGFSATGKLRVLQTANFRFTAWHDDATRLWINDQLLWDDWSNRGDGVVGIGANIVLEAGKVYRLKFDYANFGSSSAVALHLHEGVGRTGPTHYFDGWLSPGYNLVTSTKSYDAQLGASVSTASYGPNPELGLKRSTTVDPGGLNLTTTMTYEAQGAEGSFLRQISKTLPGGGTTTYAYYAATETRDSPCTLEAEAYKQAGFMKLKTEPDPDGTGTQIGRATETIYDDAGRVVATRYNIDNWTCTAYDMRGRITQTAIPQVGNEPGRTITNNWNVGGNPLVTATGDNIADITTGVDLLGRVVSYTDAHGNITTSSYDNLGRLAERNGSLGVEAFTYDNYHRLAEQRLDSTLYAVVTYDPYSRVSAVEYPNANGQQLTIGRDSLGRLSSNTFYGSVSSSTTLGPNLIANPSMETPAASNPDAPDQWIAGSWGINQPTFTYGNTGRTGTRSVKTELASHTDGDAKWYFEPTAVTGGATYQYSNYYKSDVYTSFVVQFTHQDNSLTYYWLGGANAVSSDWEQSAQRTFTAPATATKATVFHLIEAAGWLMVDDAELREVIPTSTSTEILANDSVTRSQSGQVLTNVVSSGSNELLYSYGYDKADRLVSANIGPHTYTYGFGPQDTSCGTASNMNLNAGKNSNRTSQTVSSVTTYFCYDYADKLVSSSNPVYNGATYDTHGNMTRLGTGTTPLWPGYDSSDRNWGFEQYDDNGNGAGLYYDRDVQGRIIGRYKNDITNWNWQSAGDWFYGFGGAGDSPDILRNASWQIIEKYITLPGGVLLTIKPQETSQANKATYSLPNLHGDVLLTTNALGDNTSTGNGPANSFAYDPFGSILAGSTFPTNTAVGSYAYVGQHQKLSETLFDLNPIQMGARVYLPTIGRFAQVDPVEGGTENNYVYPADPANKQDLTGQWMQIITKAAPAIGRGVQWAGGKAWQGATWAGDKASKGWNTIRSVRVSLQIHSPHHYWLENGMKVWRKHIEIRTWLKGIKKSDWRKQIPFGPRFKKPNGK